jgi:hypothetical protein
MKIPNPTRSRSGRILLAAVPVALASTFLMTGVAQGAVPVSFAVSGSQFQISASKLEGTGFSQYAGVTEDTAGGQHNVAIANIASAQLSDLCQSVVSDTPSERSACSSPRVAAAPRHPPRICRSA